MYFASSQRRIHSPHKVTFYRYLVVKCMFLWLLSYFRVAFSKIPLVAGIFSRVPEAEDFGRIYTSFVPQE